MQRHHDRRFAFTVRCVTTFARPARQRQAQNGFGHFILPDELPGEFFQFLRREWRFDFQEICAMSHAFQMLCEAERLSAADAHRFKQSVAQQKAAVIHRNDRLLLGQKLSVEKNEHAHFLTQRRKEARRKILMYFPAAPSFDRGGLYCS